MIFQHTYKKVLDGIKTQTRRLIKNGQKMIMVERPSGIHEAIYVQSGSHRLMYRKGNTYAVQPGRTQRAVGRIRITGIRCEDVRNISDGDVKAEGFASYEHFIQTWCYMHDPAANKEADKLKGVHICDVARTRPAERYQSWALTFELVEAQS